MSNPCFPECANSLAARYETGSRFVPTSLSPFLDKSWKKPFPSSSARAASSTSFRPLFEAGLVSLSNSPESQEGYSSSEIFNWTMETD